MNMWHLDCFEVLGAGYPVMQYRIPEKQNLAYSASHYTHVSSYLIVLQCCSGCIIGTAVCYCRTQGVVNTCLHGA